MNFFFPHFFCLLSAALIGWLVGWLLGRLGRGRPSETFDVESAGKIRLATGERDRLAAENAHLRATIATLRAQLDKSNSELSDARTALAERNSLRGELETALAKLSLYEQTNGGNLHLEVEGTQKIIAGYEAELRKSEELIAQLQKQLHDLRRLKSDPRTILFPVDSPEITPEAASILDDIIPVLKGLNGVRIEIAGHTDNIDTEQHNNELSRRRAEAVREYLIVRDVPSHKLTAIGYGASRPLADNATEEGRKKNRRIEFQIKQ
jgi:outer membrane protein OmpA-like peptidoglycan-associated protein